MLPELPVVMSVDDSPLFDLPAHQQLCPLCQHPLVMKNGKNGPFLGCSHYPVCQYIKPLHQHENVVVKVLEQEQCPECGHPLAVKNGRYGMFIGCTHYPACHFVVHDEPEATTEIACPSCHSGKLVERMSKFGKAFFACDAYPKCKFLLNDKPVAGQCDCCGYPLLTEKKTPKGVRYYCAAKKCLAEQPVSSTGCNAESTPDVQP